MKFKFEMDTNEMFGDLSDKKTKNLIIELIMTSVNPQKLKYELIKKLQKLEID